MHPGSTERAIRMYAEALSETPALPRRIVERCEENLSQLLGTRLLLESDILFRHESYLRRDLRVDEGPILEYLVQAARNTVKNAQFFDDLRPERSHLVPRQAYVSAEGRYRLYGHSLRKDSGLGIAFGLLRDGSRVSVEDLERHTGWTQVYASMKVLEAFLNRSGVELRRVKEGRRIVAYELSVPLFQVDHARLA